MTAHRKHERRLTLKPLTPEEALRGLLATKPPKDKPDKKAPESKQDKD